MTENLTYIKKLKKKKLNPPIIFSEYAKKWN